jgi:hypothetical protein
MAEEKTYQVTIYDPSVDAYRQVPLENAEKLLAGIEDIKANIEKVQEEKIKDELYANSLKAKK